MSAQRGSGPPSLTQKASLEVLHLTVPPKQSRVRLDVYLAHQVENATRSKVRQAIEQGWVLVDGKRVKPSHPVSPGALIEITLPRPPRQEAQAEDIPLEIVYEDDDLLVVDKPAGMVTHPAYGNYTGTLVNALLSHCQRLSSVNTSLRPGIVHRLDKDTSGLLVVAKNDRAHHLLARQFSSRTIGREYWALVWGRFSAPKGVVEASLGRSKKDRKKVAVTKEGKHARTEYELLEQYPFLSLLRLRLHTGRTHQIRVHLAHIGHPVFGDPTYGGRTATWGGLTGTKAQQAARLLKILPRQALHAKTIGFVHPTSNQHLSFDSELPNDMASVLAELRP
jgi:23S rRNA pseudouridine1911/1915/1917 synthase